MPTIVIVEGVDRSGKTTVANALSKALNVPVFRNKEFFGGAEGQWRDSCSEIEKINLMVNMVETLDADVIFDRLHLSEFVYGLVEREYVNGSIWEIDERLSSLGAIVVHVKPYDLDSSSLLHGKDLSEHEELFESAVATLTRCEVVEGTMLDVDDIVNKVQASLQLKK